MIQGNNTWAGPDETEGAPNPNYVRLMARFATRFGRNIKHAMIACTYDQTRAAVAAIAAAPLLDPEGLVAGLETLTMLPVSVGGPRSYLSYGPYDRKGFKGDWLTVRHVVQGQPRFSGYLDAQYLP